MRFQYFNWHSNGFYGFPEEIYLHDRTGKKRDESKLSKAVVSSDAIIEKKIVLGHYIVILFTQNHQILIAAAEDRIRTLIKKWNRKLSS